MFQKGDKIWFNRYIRTFCTKDSLICHVPIAVIVNSVDPDQLASIDLHCFQRGIQFVSPGQESRHSIK